MARNSDYPQHLGSTDGGYALMAVDLGGGAYRLRWVHTETLGAQGPVGDAGSPGADNSTIGEKGDTGETGVTGPVGPAGAAGIPGLSAAEVQPNILLDDGLAMDYFEDYADGQSSGFNAGRGWAGDWSVSGGQIVTRTTHNGIIQKRLELTSGEIGRTFRFSSIWNKIQVGILCRIDAASLPAMDYYLGVCSGTANMASSPTCANFIGQRGSAITWTPLAFAAQDSLLSSATQLITRRVNTDTVNSTIAGLVVPSTEACLGEIWFEITRARFSGPGDPVTYTHRILAVSGASVNAGMSMMKSSFINSMHTGLTPSDGFVGSLDSSVAPTFDQSTGSLDTFNFYWNCPTPIEIGAVAIRKVY